MALIAVTSAYRLKRLTAFLDPWADPFNSGFQLTQSLIAIGRGELFGVGLGSSVQKLFYLPEAHTDFVFAVLAEGLRLAGVIFTLALFMALVWRAFHISRLAAEAGLAFQAYCAAGFGVWLALQTFINIGVNTGILPTKGLTLPLMSYGPSSMLVTIAWLGLIMRAHHEASTAGRLAVSRRERTVMTRGAVLIMAGGTGGHVFPALAAARVLRERGYEPVWLGTQRGLEAKLVPPQHIEMEWITMSGVRGKGLTTWLAAPFRSLRGRSGRALKSCDAANPSWCSAPAGSCRVRAAWRPG